MAQQINLLSPALRRPRDWLSLRTVFAAVVGAAALLLLLGVWLAWQLDTSHQGEVAAQDAGLQQAQAQVATLKTRLAERRLAMDSEMRRVREIEQAIARVQQALHQGEHADDEPYSAYFEALSNQAHGSLWITGFSVSADGRQLELRGQALDAAVLPDYLGRLNAEPLFQGRRFDHLTLGSAPAEGPDGSAPAYSEFVLRTGGVLEPGDGRESRP